MEGVSNSRYAEIKCRVLGVRCNFLNFLHFTTYIFRGILYLKFGGYIPSAFYLFFFHLDLFVRLPESEKALF